jgi:predicted PurR-regulated permease PerM
VDKDRVVLLRPRTVLQVAGVLLGVASALWVVWIAREVITWILVSLFLAIALNPAVGVLQRRGVKPRGAAAGLIYFGAVLVIAGLAALLVPPLIDQASGFGKALPGYVHDLTAGKGPLGFLERKYHIVEKARQAVSGGPGGGASKLLGGAGTVISITRSVVTAVVGFVTILFLTFFMILEGPAWVERGIALLPEPSQPRWRAVCDEISRTVSGYVTGNLLISAIAGGSCAIVLVIVGVPFPIALGLVVAILDLIPLAGATLAGILLAIVAFLTSLTAGIVVVTYFVIYQQVENHLLQPLVYGRTVQLSPLVVLIAVLIGAQVAGVLGALGAIPVAGTLQILLVDFLRHRRGEAAAEGKESRGGAAAEGDESRGAEGPEIGGPTGDDSGGPAEAKSDDSGGPAAAKGDDTADAAAEGRTPVDAPPAAGAERAEQRG